MKRLITICAVIVLALLSGTPTQAVFIYVSCDSTIEKFDSSGNRSTFATYTYASPTGLAFDNFGNLYANWLSGEIVEKFDSSGNRSTFASNVGGALGIACDSLDNLYVSCASGTIYKFDSSGNRSILYSGSSDTFGIAVDKNNNLYYSVLADGTINKIDSSGNRSIFASGLDAPTGLAIDSLGNLYVSLVGSGSEIDKFDTNGNKSIFAICPLNMEIIGLAFDSLGNLYAGNDKGTIEKFDSMGNRSVFASGLDWPTYIAVQPVPEPATILLLGLGAVMWFDSAHHRLRKRR